jgi:hypothetical protein
VSNYFRVFHTAWRGLIFIHKVMTRISALLQSCRRLEHIT